MTDEQNVCSECIFVHSFECKHTMIKVNGCTLSNHDQRASDTLYPPFILSIFDIASNRVIYRKCVVKIVGRTHPLILVGPYAITISAKLKELHRRFMLELNISALDYNPRNLSDDWVCAICLDDKADNNDEVLSNLTCCNQVIHKPCMSSVWMVGTWQCPLCRSCKCPFCQGEGTC